MHIFCFSDCRCSHSIRGPKAAGYVTHPRKMHVTEKVCHPEQTFDSLKMIGKVASLVSANCGYLYKKGVLQNNCNTPILLFHIAALHGGQGMVGINFQDALGIFLLLGNPPLSSV